MQVIDLSQQRSRDTIDFGALVTLLNVSDDAPEDIEPVLYRLVDQMEADPAQNKLSIQSPLGRALMGKQVEEDVLLSLQSFCQALSSHSYDYTSSLNLLEVQDDS